MGTAVTRTPGGTVGPCGYDWRYSYTGGAFERSERVACDNWATGVGVTRAAEYNQNVEVYNRTGVTRRAGCGDQAGIVGQHVSDGHISNSPATAVVPGLTCSELLTSPVDTPGRPLLPGKMSDRQSCKLHFHAPHIIRNIAQ